MRQPAALAWQPTVVASALQVSTSRINNAAGNPLTIINMNTPGNNPDPTKMVRIFALDGFTGSSPAAILLLLKHGGCYP